MKVMLAGKYPANTYEKLKESLPAQVELVEVRTQEAYDSMTDAGILILRQFKAPREVLERNKGLKLVMRWGVGFDSVDIEAAGELGIPVANTPGANAGAVSEHAVLLMLALGRNLVNHVDSLRNGIWSANTFLNQSFTLNNKVVGIVGAGNIGRKVAEKVHPFGAETIYYDPYRLSAEREKEFGLTYVELDELLKRSDIVTIHVPLTEENFHLIDAEKIKEMKEGAILINTSRGGLVDDAAVLEAVRGGRLRGAGLDVVEEDPLPADHPLLHTNNIIVTPHVAGGTADLGDVIIPMLRENILCCLAHEELKYVVNQNYLPVPEMKERKTYREPVSCDAMSGAAIGTERLS